MDEKTAFNRLKPCARGMMVYNINDTYIGRSLDLYGEYSEGEVELFARYIKPGDMVLDIGANIGVFTVFFAKTVGETGAVIAFEPQRLIFQSLCANVALNSLTNVLCWQQAVGEAKGSIVVPLLDQTKPNNFGGVALGGWETGETIPLVTIDDLNLPQCDFMKIDVEGMERKVLFGARDTIRRHRPVLYVENDRPEEAAGLLNLLGELDYRMYQHQPPLFRPDNFTGHRENVFGDIVSGNVLCLHKSFKSEPGGAELVAL